MRNKNFYLDTNIIYRALGINGGIREKRTKVFLKKFVDAGETIIISKATDKEFREGIHSHIRKLEEYNSPRVNSRLFQSVEVQKDIFSFYHKWRIGKVNTNLNLFSAEVIHLYDSLRKEFNIEIDNLIPYDLKNEKTTHTINDYISSISTFKQSEKLEHINTAQADSENVLWVETKRNGNDTNIFNTKYFFISTDQSLRRWDFQRENITPVVLLPSQWMTILLRYFNCTSDDYKSFISFLNLKNNERLIDGQKLQIVLAGIGELTETIEQQEYILNSLVETQFKKVINKNSTSEQIFISTKKIAKNLLEEQIKAQKLDIDNLIAEKESIKTFTNSLNENNNNINKKYSELSTEFESHKSYTEELINNAQIELNVIKEKFQFIDTQNKELQRQISIKDKEVEDKTKQLEAIINKNRENYINKELNSWKNAGILCIPLVFIIILFFFFHIFSMNGNIIIFIE